MFWASWFSHSRYLVVYVYCKKVLLSFVHLYLYYIHIMKHRTLFILLVTLSYNSYCQITTEMNNNFSYGLYSDEVRDNDNSVQCGLW